jgi:hypothetical protein
MGKAKLTPEEEAAYKDMAAAARRLKEAERNAEKERLSKRAARLGFSLVPLKDANDDQ